MPFHEISLFGMPGCWHKNLFLELKIYLEEATNYFSKSSKSKKEFIIIFGLFVLSLMLQISFFNSIDFGILIENKKLRRPCAEENYV